MLIRRRLFRLSTLLAPRLKSELARARVKARVVQASGTIASIQPVNICAGLLMLLIGGARGWGDVALSGVVLCCVASACWQSLRNIKMLNIDDQSLARSRSTIGIFSFFIAVAWSVLLIVSAARFGAQFQPLVTGVAVAVMALGGFHLSAMPRSAILFVTTLAVGLVFQIANAELAVRCYSGLDCSSLHCCWRVRSLDRHKGSTLSWQLELGPRDCLPIKRKPSALKRYTSAPY